MGSFRASFEFAGKEFDVLQAEYSLNRNTDTKGKPSSSVNGGRITLTIESTSDTSVIEAMVNSQFKAVDGKIVFKKTDEDSKMKEVEFKNAYIVYFKEDLDVNNEIPMKLTVTFSAEELLIGNANLDNRWPVA
ncbi:type VI secretion system tube protein TssD [Tenacibaculum sp.]|uniref:type VI secretion system tube protein TssD n=1 Tax=Tenacibaculum sp. TaxID=1906242 RepID=UPI003AA93D75